MNLHTPERQPHETQRAYRERQALSREAVRDMRCHGTPGHKAPSSRQRLRDLQRDHGTLKAGSYGRGLRNWITQKALEAHRG